MRSLRSLVAALLLFAAASGAAQAGVVLLGTRVVYPGQAKEKTLQMTNRGDKPAVVQSWIDDDQPNVDPHQIHVPFVLTPALSRLDPNQGQALRLHYVPDPAKPLPDDRESVFYLNVLEIPPKPENADARNLLQLAVRNRIKLFYRPASLSGKPEEAASTLTWTLRQEAGKSVIEVHNPSAYYVSINKVAFDGIETEPAMVAPKSNAMLPLNKVVASARSSNQLTVEWINDQGGVVTAKQSFSPGGQP